MTKACYNGRHNGQLKQPEGREALCDLEDLFLKVPLTPLKCAEPRLVCAAWTPGRPHTISWCCDVGFVCSSELSWKTTRFETFDDVKSELEVGRNNKNGQDLVELVCNCHRVKISCNLGP